MASLKEYQMMFQLQAKTSSGFSGAFRTAQTTLQTMQQKITELNKTQSDIAAYEKQQSAVEATRQKLETLQKQYDNIQQEIKETEGFSSSLENQLLSKQQQIDKTSASLDKQTQKLDTMGNALRDAGVDTDHLASESDRLTAEISELKTEEEQVAEKAANMGESGVDAANAIASALAAAGIVTALKKIGEAYMTCINNAGEFEETMSTVEALSGASAEEMNALSEEAKRLGASTKFTANEAAEAMTYMGMAGWDANDMLKGMDGVLSLAAASGEDLARTSDIVTDNLTAFGLKASDTAHFSDVLAAAATNSNTNVSIMGETFKNSASIAGALGYSVDDVAVAVGLMANAGVKGSLAGTALKNTFNGLLEGATLTSGAFGEYEFSALKADGTMKSFSSTIDELRFYFDQMTEAEKVSNAQAIAGKRSYNGLLAILNASDEDYASLTESIRNCSGAAQNMASIKMDNMNGQLTLMKSAWDAVTISVGEQFTPALTGLYEKGTDVLTWVNDMVQANPELVAGVTAFVGVLGLAVAGVTAFTAAAKVMKALNLGSVFTGIPGIVAIATAAIVGGVAAQEKAMQDELATYNEVLEGYDKDTEEYLTNMQNLADQEGSITGLLDELDSLKDKTDKTATEKMRMADIVDRLNTALPELGLQYDQESDKLTGYSGSIREYVKQMTEAAEMQEKAARYNFLGEDIGKTQAALNDANAELERLQKNKQGLVESGGEIGFIDMDINAYTLKVQELSAQLASEQEEYAQLDAELDAYDAAQQEATETTSEATDITDELAQAQQELSEKYAEVYEAALDSYQGQFSLFEKADDVAQTSVSDLMGNLDSQIAYWSDYNSNLQTVMDMIASLASQGIDTSNIQNYLNAINDGSPEAAGAIAAMASSSETDLATMGEKYGELMNKQGETASSTASLQTDFAAALATMGGDMDKFVAELNRSGDASAAAGSTANAYLSTFNAYQDAAYTAGVNMGNRLLAGLRSVTGGAGIGGYASGTESAEPGFAYVGENGPELIFFHGGEEVLNATETAAMKREMEAQAAMPVFAEPTSVETADGIGGGDTPVYLTYSPMYEIKGVDNATDLEAVLRGHDESFRVYIQDVMEDIASDAARRRY